MSVPNGHVDDSLDDGREPSAQPQRSESDLSDLNDAPPAQTGPQQAHSDDDAIHDMATSEMDDDEDEDAPGEEDADYEMASPIHEAADEMQHDRPSSSSSEEDVRSGKRKPEIDDEEYMKQNPELYGLRRSVRTLHCVYLRNSLTRCQQGRARPTRRVVRAPFLGHMVVGADTLLQMESSDDDEEDDDDVNTGSRRKRRKVANGRSSTHRPFGHDPHSHLADFCLKDLRVRSPWSSLRRPNPSPRKTTLTAGKRVVPLPRNNDVPYRLPPQGGILPI